MTRINWTRVFVGGLVAGFIINAFEIFWSGFVLRERWQAAMQAIHHPLPAAAIWIFALEALAMGVAAIWLYAVARARFGPGPRTALLSAAGYWVIGYALPAVGIGQTGLFPVQLLAMTHFGGLLEIMLATLAGASFYKD